MDPWWYPLAIFATAALGGVVAGAAIHLIGGVGVVRQLRNRMQGLESDIDLLEQRLTREIKRRAGLQAAETRSEEKGLKALQHEAAVRLAQPANKPATPEVPGFPTMFNRG